MYRTNTVIVYDQHPQQADFLRDVLEGLSKPRKEVPAKYFYDAAGSALFDAICELPEYYPTRTEIGLLHAHGAQIGAFIDAPCRLIEYGSGSSRKIPLLLRALRRKAVAYMAIDICRDQLLRALQRLAAQHPGMEVAGLCADYTQLTELPARRNGKALRTLIYFAGSTIGNYHPPEAITLLRNAACQLDSGGAMLIGVDLKKDPALLWRAYNDAQGVTARFNLNLLARINRELGADFVPAQFRHQAHYNAAAGRVEMHLVSRRTQQVWVGGQRFHFALGETLHTENSYKYGVEEFQVLAQAAGFRPAGVWVDPDRLFSLHYLAMD